MNKVTNNLIRRVHTMQKYKKNKNKNFDRFEAKTTHVVDESRSCAGSERRR
jgi:predicted secreted Zn-dependent protease